MNKAKYFAVSFLPILLLFGCAANGDNQAVGNHDNNEAGHVQNRDSDIGIQSVRSDNNDINRSNEAQIEATDKAAERIAALDEVRTAKVIVTNDNAYVAVVLNDGEKGEVTEQTKNKIADLVRKTDPNIQNVFVSSNPDFVEGMENYSNSINESGPLKSLENDPLRDLYEEFTGTIEENT